MFYIHLLFIILSLSGIWLSAQVRFLNSKCPVSDAYDYSIHYTHKDTFLTLPQSINNHPRLYNLFSQKQSNRLPITFPEIQNSNILISQNDLSNELNVLDIIARVNADAEIKIPSEKQGNASGIGKIPLSISGHTANTSLGVYGGQNYGNNTSVLPQAVKNRSHEADHYLPAPNTLMLYHIPVQMNPLNSHLPHLKGKLNPENIRKFISDLEPAFIQQCLDTLLLYNKILKHGDAGFYFMCGAIARHIFPYDLNETRLFSTLLMQAYGINVQPGIQGESIVQIVHTLQDLYEVPRLNSAIHNSKKHGGFFLWQNDSVPVLNSAITSAGTNSQDKLRPLDLSMRKSPVLSDSYFEEMLIFRDPVSRRTDTFSVRQSHAHLNFLNSLPQMSPEIYFAKSLSPEVHNSLIPQLKARVVELRPHEALGWLLRFVQLTFPYMTDEQQFGKEKAMFAEEALFYAYTDCEDRSALFALLVREVLNRPVIGLDFPGHMATAVMVPKKEARGARIRYAGHTFMVCDPSYKRGMPGSLMPEFTSIKPIPIPAPFK